MGNPFLLVLYPFDSSASPPIIIYLVAEDETWWAYMVCMKQPKMSKHRCSVHKWSPVPGRLHPNVYATPSLWSIPMYSDFGLSPLLF